MIVVVEIASRTGTRACKEYGAPSCNAAIETVKRELRGYPAFRVTDFRSKTVDAARKSRRVVNSAWDRPSSQGGLHHQGACSRPSLNFEYSLFVRVASSRFRLSLPRYQRQKQAHAESPEPIDRK
jgi:hypothetical protein